MNADRFVVVGCRATLLAVAAALCLSAASARALPDDSTQPIQIQADRAELDQRKGTAVYIGAVQLVQGTLTVTSARLTISSINGEVTKILAEGDKTPAHYSQRAKPDQPPLLANAHTITYLTKEGRIRLDGDAHLTQGKNAFQGPMIDYDITRQLVSANGGTGRGGVKVTIDPNKVDRAGNSGERSSGDANKAAIDKSELHAVSDASAGTPAGTASNAAKVDPVKVEPAKPAAAKPAATKPEPAQKN